MEKRSPAEKSVAKLTWLIFFLILACGASVVALNLANVDFVSGTDEGHYLKYSSLIADRGLGIVPQLFSDYLADKSAWAFPNPLRIGYLVIAALWLKIAGYYYINLAFLSLLFYCLYLLTSFYFIKKYLGGAVALFSSSLIAFSPLAMAMARRALLESAVCFSWALTLWLFYAYFKERKRYQAVLFILSFVLAILIKETAVLMLLIFIPYLIWKNYPTRKENPALKPYLVAAAPLLITILAYTAFGVLRFVPQIVKIILASPASNIYALRFGGGPWSRYLIDYILLSPWTAVLAVGFIFCFLTQEKKDDSLSYLLFSGFCAYLIFCFFTKNIRYIIMLDYIIRIFAALMIQKTWMRLYPKKALGLTAITVLLICGFDLFNFYGFFVRQGIYDPVSFQLLIAQKIIPTF